jgi:hypothetical protein
LPLTQKVTFKVQLQNQNRFQVPKVIRWHYKLEASQLLKVNLAIFKLGFYESFLGKMLSDGRITVPRLVIVELMQTTPDLKAYFIEVALEPV